jgi:hypothetical protein
VQILEVTDLGLRSAAMRLHRRGTPMTFLVIPMVHMANAGFYRDVTRLLRDTDLIVAEGIRGKSTLGSVLTATYRVLGRRRATNLVEQEIPYTALGKPVINPDVTAAEFGMAWQKAPLRQRVLMWLMMLVMIPLQLVMPKQQLMRRIADLEINDLPSDMDEAMAEQMPEFEKAVLGDRDLLLLEALRALIDERGHEEITVGVVYGAGHTPAIVQGLRDRDYIVRSAEWLSVIDL